MIATFFFGVILSAYQQPKVTLELRGVRMENAAIPLARALGMESLDIGPTLKDQVILLRVKDVDPELLKANLAKVFNGTWEHRNEGWRFTQSDIQKDAERKEYDKARYMFFSEMIEKSKRKIATLKPFNEEECKKILKDLKVIASTPVTRNNNSFWQRISKIEEQSPMSRFAYRASLRMSPEVWMRLTDDNPRVVFSTRPTGMQQPFPFRIDDLLQLAMKEQNTWSNFAGGEPMRGPRAGSENEESYYWLGEFNEHRQPFTTKDLDIVTMTLQLTNQSVNFRAYDSKGKSTFRSEVNSYDYSDEELNFDYKAEYEKMKKKMVKVEGDAAEYLDILSPLNRYGRGREKRKPISPSLLAKILNPEKIDPLSISAPDVYLGNIDSPNVVMVMNDSQRAVRMPEFKDVRFIRFKSANIIETDGWFLLSQPNPYAVRKMMPDRKLLGPMLRFMNTNKRPLNIEEQAKFALQLPWNNEAAYQYQEHLRDLVTNEVEGDNSRNALRVYGSLTSGQIDRAKKGGIAISQLSDSAKQEMFRAIFYSDQGDPQVQLDWSAMRNDNQKFQQQMMEMQNLLYGGIYEEKTFLLPNGLTNNLVLTIDDSELHQLYCGRPERNGSNEDYYGEGRTMSGTELGEFLFKSHNPQRYRWEVQSYNKIDENNIRTASRRSIRMKLKFDNILSLSWNLNQTLITDPTVYTAQNLPSNILAEIKKGYDQAEKSDKNYQSYGGAPTRINPPPR
ncbi:MAG: hypothetical protein WCG75_03300 [Armatimonadota bacterium]